MPEAVEPVVTSAGPILALGFAGQVGLLRALHGLVLVPTAVAEECARPRPRRWPPARPVALPTWVETVVPRSGPQAAAADLDLAEAAVIALALERGIRVVAIDEKEGRLVAKSLGLAVTGSLGVLLRAKALGLVPAVKPHIESIQANGRWYSRGLVEAALLLAREA